jgi:hypothetical protein
VTAGLQPQNSDFAIEFTLATSPFNAPAHLVPWVHTWTVAALCLLQQHLFGYRSGHLIFQNSMACHKGCSPPYGAILYLRLSLTLGLPTNRHPASQAGLQ